MRTADVGSINLVVPESEPGGYGKRNMSVMPQRQRSGDRVPSNFLDPTQKDSIAATACATSDFTRIRRAGDELVSQKSRN